MTAAHRVLVMLDGPNPVEARAAVSQCLGLAGQCVVHLERDRRQGC
jgi:hypothetical protein